MGDSRWLCRNHLATEPHSKELDKRLHEKVSFDAVFESNLLGYEYLEAGALAMPYRTLWNHSACFVFCCLPCCPSLVVFFLWQFYRISKFDVVKAVLSMKSRTVTSTSLLSIMLEMASKNSKCAPLLHNLACRFTKISANFLIYITL